MIDHIDHVVLTTSRREECIRFYTEVLGMRFEQFGENRFAFMFGNQKVNLHVQGRELEPRAHLPVPGSQDWCFIASVPLEAVIAKLEAANVPILLGPVLRAGAVSQIRSVYVRDPDLNLIEIAEPVATA